MRILTTAAVLGLASKPMDNENMGDLVPRP